MRASWSNISNHLKSISFKESYCLIKFCARILQKNLKTVAWLWKNSPSGPDRSYFGPLFGGRCRCRELTIYKPKRTLMMFSGPGAVFCRSARAAKKSGMNRAFGTTWKMALEMLTEPDSATGYALIAPKGYTLISTHTMMNRTKPLFCCFSTGYAINYGQCKKNPSNSSLGEREQGILNLRG